MLDERTDDRQNGQLGDHVRKRKETRGLTRRHAEISVQACKALGLLGTDSI